MKLGGNGQFNTETQITHLSELAGNATFDGRALHLENLQVRADEGSARLNGSITLIAREQAVNLMAAGSLDAGPLARLTTLVTDLGDGSGDPGLDNALAEILLRVEVELAKFGAPQHAVDRRG